MKKRIKKLRRKAKNYPRNYLSKLKRQFNNHPIKSFFWMILSPIIIYVIAQIIFTISLLATVGYIFACIIGFSDILKKPLRIIYWGGGYMLGAFAIYLFVNILFPRINAINATNIFAGIIIAYGITVLYFNARKLRKK